MKEKKKSRIRKFFEKLRSVVEVVVVVIVVVVAVVVVAFLSFGT